ncbi:MULTISPECIES: hypothetical protein [Streptomyces]|nr:MULTISPECIES: hypothetical protein [Streptomyces]MCX4659674.1 hypothetical protein [Streptomyces uncialis]WST67769.1 hypothetical protein OG268_09700 [Streptomyces uncialis]WTE13593.1 hypothetical protein OG924_27240 [Streptomyces uncialis]
MSTETNRATGSRTAGGESSRGTLPGAGKRRCPEGPDATVVEDR